MIALTERLAIVAVVLGSAFALVSSTFAAQSAATPPTSGTYVGKSSEGSPVTFKVSAGGTKITSFVGTLVYNGKCGQGGGPGFSVKSASIRITTGGHFAATVHAADNATKATLQLTGIVANRSAHGSIVEPKPFFKCTAPHQNVNPYSETFTASTK